MKPNYRDIHLADQVQEVTHVIKLRCLFLVCFFFFFSFFFIEYERRPQAITNSQSPEKTGKLLPLLPRF